MEDKIQKIREEVEKLKSQLIRGACSSQISMETMCKEEAYNEVLAILDTMQEEPVSEDLEEAGKQYLERSNPDRVHQITNAFKAGAKWQKEKEYTCYEEAFEDGAKWKKEQMIANAIDGTARPDDNEIWCNLASSNLKDGNKIKVVVIKED